jgi:hypothetical protein
MSEQLRRLTDKELKSPAQIYIEELEAENARLQARVEEIQGHLELCRRFGVRFLAERDGYKALAERRGAALEDELSRHIREIHWNGTEQPHCSRCQHLKGAALDAVLEEASTRVVCPYCQSGQLHRLTDDCPYATPEEAREKERR